MMVSFSFAQRDWPHAAGFAVTVDPARMAYGVMTGMGLLCAGSIIKEGPTVHGMTTASGLWCATALGLSAGMGLYLLTIGAAVLVVAVLWLLTYVEDRLPRTKYGLVTVRRTWEVHCIAKTVQDISKTGLKVSDVNFARRPEGNEVDISCLIGFPARSTFYELAEKIENSPELNLVAAKNL